MNKTAADEKKYLLSEERLIVRHSGEIPEVAYHGSLYYLTEDPDGPGLVLDNKDLQSLKEEVVNRYRKIMLRDLNPENRDKGLYRGVERCICNWKRLVAFCGKEKRNADPIRAEAASALVHFMRREKKDADSGTPSCINCSAAKLEEFAQELGLNPAKNFPPGWQDLCL